MRLEVAAPTHFVGRSKTDKAYIAPRYSYFKSLNIKTAKIISEKKLESRNGLE